MTKRTIKECTKCHKIKPMQEFHVNRRNKDGHIAQCKACISVLSLEYRSTRKDEINAYQREYRKTETSKANQRASEARDRARNPHKHLARQLLSNAVRAGKIERLPCEICGSTDRIEGHHEDYSTPFEVNWFCKEHHDQHHRENS